jgi:oligopeptide transport system substrate-binding protein
MRQSARRTTLFSMLTLAGSVALLLAGCSIGSGGVTTLPDSQQIVRLQLPGTDIKSLDPANATDLYSGRVIEVVYPGLVVLDKNLTAIPWAATALPDVSADGLTWTFHVRPGLKWSDGTAITAETYAFSMDRAENPCNAFGAAYYLYAIKDAAAFNGEDCNTATNTIKGPIQTLLGDSIVVVDPQTLKVTLATPATYFLYAMTYPTSWAVPEQLVKQFGAKWTDHMADGSGMGGDLFKVTKWDHAGHLSLTRNDTFWGQKPKLHEVDYTFFKDSNTAYNAFQAGQQDVGAAPASKYAQAAVRPNFHQVPVQDISYYAMNWKIAPFDDVRMRQAFAIALDKTTLANTVLHGTVTATNHIVPDGMPGFNPDLKGPDGTTGLGGNPTMANQLATQYATEKKCGTSTDFSNCPKVTLTITSGSTDGANEAAAAQQMWLKAMPKYPITITSVDFNTLLQNLSTKRVQFWAIGWIEDYPDPQDWLTTNLACDSSYNSGDACDQQADGLMKQADANPDLVGRLAQYQQAEQILVTKVGWLSLSQGKAWWEVKPTLHNYTLNAGGIVPKEAWQAMYVTSK